jgi:hypothetical protein
VLCGRGCLHYHARAPTSPMNFPHASQPRPGQEDLERSRLNGHGFRNVFEGEVCRRHVPEDQHRAREADSSRVVTKRQQDYGSCESERAGTALLIENDVTHGGCHLWTECRLVGLIVPGQSGGSTRTWLSK